MAYERVWPQFSALFTANGATTGVITVNSTIGLYTKQVVTITGTALTALPLEIKEVLSPTTARVGAVGVGFSGTDVSAYTTSAAGAIFASQQEKKDGGSNSVIKDVYEAEPTVALRVFGVDSSGNPGIASSQAAFQFAAVAAASVTAGNSTVTTGFAVMTFTSL